MDQVRHTSEIVELYSYPLKSFYSSVNSNDDEIRIKNSGEFDLTDARKCLTGSILRDDKASLMIQLKQLIETSPNQNIFKEDENRDAELLDRSIASKLLRLCCMFDSVECASALISGEFGTVPRVNELDDNGKSALHTAADVHATRCIELLLRKRARTDLKSKDGQSQLALELSLSSRRMGVVWTVDDPIENLLVCLNQKDLTAVRLLSEKTKEIGEVAHTIAMDGQAVSLAALLMVAAEKVTTWIVPVRTDGEKKTIYDCVIKEALSLSPAAGEETCVLKNSSESSEKRRFLLCELELFLLYGAVAQSGSADKKVVSPLIRASQVGDEAVLKILLKTKMDVNEVDAEGNSALHWALKMSPASASKQIKIIWLLLKHGARVGQRNRLGLTAAHIASANGYIKALQILLLADPDGVHTTTEMKETPLFFAVKNDFMDCVELLLCLGANTEVLNLRKQRPIDFAKSQDMRFMLNPTNIGFMNRAFSSQQKFAAVSHEDEVVLETYESILAMMDEVPTTDRICPSNKTEICRYFESPGGCVRGSKCFYAHGEEELRQTKQGIKCFHSRTSELNRRVFVGGLQPSLDSESLGKFFEQFGSVEDAQVVAVQTGNELQSRGFGFVTFKHESSVSVAVQEHYIIIMGKQVEIKSAVPKSLLLSELQKSPPQQQKEQKSNQLEPQTPSTDGKNTDNNCSTVPISWADRVLQGQPKTYSNENQAHVSPTSMDQREPAWLTTFKKWLPKFLKDVSLRLREGEWYPLSSLKGDFRATRGLELDHASLGYLKLSEFMRSLPGICRMKIVPVGGRGPATHMVLLPNSPKLDPVVVKPMKKPDTPPCTKSSDENGNGDSDDFVILQEAFFASYDDLGSYSSIGGDYLFHETPENNSDTVLIVRPSFLQFLEPDPLFHARPWLRNATGHADWEGEKGVTKLCNQERHLVLEALARKRNNTSVFFLREYDFYENYKASIAKGKCFACSQHQILWANYPCRHLLWCDKCKVHAAQAAGTSKHKCVICDAEVQRFELLPQQVCYEVPRMFRTF